jgi:nucleoid-associated protein YgaU
MGYVSFDSLHEKSSFFNKDSTENSITTDQELIKILGTIDINSVAVEEKNKFTSLSSAIDSVVNDSSSEDTSPYTQALSREINREKERLVIVRKGDTLASLSEEYYGNSTAYTKILKANKSLSQTSYTIFVGQELVLPY